MLEIQKINDAIWAAETLTSNDDEQIRTLAKSVMELGLAVIELDKQCRKQAAILALATASEEELQKLIDAKVKKAVWEQD